MNWLSLVLCIIWIYILTVLKRGKLDFWYFFFGSVGLFIFSFLWIEPIVVEPIQQMVTAVAGLLGKVTGLYKSYFDKSIIFISHNTTNISLYIEFECSGVIESLAFLSLLWFFPVYKLYEKVVVSLLGIVGIFLSNVIRIFVICSIVYFCGESSYFLAHAIIGRLVFYVCTIVLYFYVFTKAQIIRQTIGGFTYGNNKQTPS